MKFAVAFLCFVVAAALVVFCATLTITAEGAAEIVFSNIALAGAGTLLAMAWEPLVDEASEIIDITIPTVLARARSSRRRWLRLLAGGVTALSFGAQYTQAN